MKEQDLSNQEIQEKMVKRSFQRIEEISRLAGELMSEDLPNLVDFGAQVSRTVACGSTTRIVGEIKADDPAMGKSSPDAGCNEDEKHQKEAIDEAKKKAKEKAKQMAIDEAGKLRCQTGCLKKLLVNQITYDLPTLIENPTKNQVGNFCEWTAKAITNAYLDCKCQRVNADIAPVQNILIDV